VHLWSGSEQMLTCETINERHVRAVSGKESQKVPCTTQKL